jgi:antitoxin HicB
VRLWSSTSHERYPIPEFDVVFEPQVEGGYTVYVPDLPGCVSEGETLEEATAMIREAMALYLESRSEHG